MAAPVTTEIRIDGVLWGARYLFKNKGDILSEHAHLDAGTNHITILAFGGIRLLGDPHIDGKEFWSKADGQMLLNWPLGILHGAEALEDGTVFFNLLKIRP